MDLMEDKIDELQAKLNSKDKSEIVDMVCLERSDLLDLLIEAEYRGELEGMDNCYKNINVTLNDNRGFLTWFNNRKYAIQTAYLPKYSGSAQLKAQKGDS